MWPEQRSLKPVLRCFLAYLAPWRPQSLLPDAAAAPGAAHHAGGAPTPHASLLGAQLADRVTDLVHRVNWHEPGGRAGEAFNQG
jgi:hypothetical protein